jgi:hypothetical protein
MCLEFCPLSQHDFLVGRWLFCISHVPYLVSIWCMLGGSVEVLFNEEYSTQFIEGQTYFGMPRGAK